MSSSRLALALALLSSVSGCSGDPRPSTPGAAARRTAPEAVRVEGRRFRDGLGRELLFRGYNAKVTPLFDVTFDDGRRPTQVFPEFTAADAQRYEQLGFSALRLPINWSGLEPQPQQYREAFFEKLAEVLTLAAAHHFYVIIDFHQDAYSKEIGEDGAPLWAIVPPPEQLLEGPYDDARRLSGQVLSAGFSFFDNAPATDGRPLQEAFVAAAQRVAERVVGHPWVLGFEAFNEPVVLSTDQLDAFHQRFAEGVHAVDRDAPIFFEPPGTRNQADRARQPEAPWAYGPGVYAPHIYTAWFSRPSQDNWASEDPAVLENSMLLADAEAAAWGTPLFITEFGCDQTVERGPRWLAAELDLQDRLLASSTAWIWAEAGSWGLHDGAHQERSATARVMARMVPRAIAGDLLAIERPTPAQLRVRYRALTQPLEHEVSVADDFYSAVTVRCDDTPVEYVRHPGRITFRCPAADGREHWLTVQGG